MREHGTRTRYVHGPNENDTTGIPCRCDPCRAANSEATAAAARRTEPAYVGAERARAHVRWLSTQGVGLKAVVKAAGVSQGALWKLMYGKRGRPSKRIRRDTETRILAVMPTQAQAGARVPAGPALEAIGQLLARGWTKIAIARAIGNPDARALQVGKAPTVLKVHADRIRELLDQPVPARTSTHGTTYQPTPKRLPVTTPPVDRWDDIEQFQEAMATLLEARIDQAQWRRRAACITHPKHLFFPGRGDNKMVQAARAVCATCPVQAECLEANLDQKQGIWAGTTEHDRRQLRRETAA